MAIIHRVLLTVGFLLLLGVSGVMTACNTENSPTVLPNTTQTPPEITDPIALVAAVTQAMTEVESFRIDLTSTFTIDDHNVSTSILSTIAVLIDLKNEQLYMDQTAVNNSTTEGFSQRKESYWVNGWAYMINDPTNVPQNSNAGNWYKYPLEAKAVTSSTYSNQPFLDTLKMETVVILGSERMNGIECYKLGVSGDYSRLFLPQNPELFSNINFIVWIGKANYRFVALSLSYNAEQAGATLDNRTSFNYSQYNQIKINLPAVALDAVQIPPPPVPPFVPAQSQLPEILSNVQKAIAELKSFSLEMFSSTEAIVTDIQVDILNQIYYLDQKVAPQRAEFYYTPDAVYQRAYGSSVWVIGPGIGEELPLFATHPFRIAYMLKTAEISLSSGSSGNVECYVLYVRDGFADYLGVNPTKVTDLDFRIFVSQESFQIISVNVSYKIQNGATIEYRNNLNFSDSNEITLSLPEAITVN